MLAWLKKYFVPHNDNQHHPHMLRTEALVFFLSVVFITETAFLVGTSVILPQSGLFSLILPSALVQSANSDRQVASAPQLTTNPLLERAAQLKAQDMATYGYFAHTSPQGVTPWYWLEKAGYRYTTAGENLAVNFLDSRDVHTAWMASPGHRANILNGAYTQIGIGTAVGMYKGFQTTFVVEFFGKPKKPLVPKVVAANIPQSSPTASLQPTVLSAVDPVVDPTPLSFPSVAPLATLAISEPRTATSTVLIVIAMSLVLALGLTIVIRMEFPHPHVVLKPMLVVLVIVSILVLNRYIGLGHAVIF